MNLIDVLGPFVILVVMIAAVAGIYLRQGRNRALERLILQREGGSIAAFRGTLAVEESAKPAISISLVGREWPTSGIR